MQVSARHADWQRSYQRWWIAAAIGLGMVAATILLLRVVALPAPLHETDRLVAHALDVLDAAASIEAHIERMTDDGRGYLNSGDPANLARTEALMALVSNDAGRLRDATMDSAGERAVADQIGALVDARIAALRRLTARQAAGDETAMREAYRTHDGRALTEQIVARTAAIKAAERDLLEARETAVDATTSRTVVAGICLGVVAAACAVCALILLIVRRRERRHFQELNRASALLHAILQTTHGLVYAKDTEGRIVAANDAALKSVGKTWSELKGRTDREFHDNPEQALLLMANDRRVMTEGTTETVEEPVGLNGEPPRIWLSTKTPMRDAEGVVIGMVGVAVDITERKHAEEQLQAFNEVLEARIQARTAELAASEARQRAYFRNSPIGMLVMRGRDDGEFVLEDINPTAVFAFGLRANGLRGRTHAQLWPEPVALAEQRQLQDCASRRQVIAYRASRQIDGETRLLDIMLAPLPDDGVHAHDVLICVRDTTRQHDLERQVIEQAERQAEAAEREMALFRNSPDELFVVRVEERPGGPAFVFEDFSPALETLTGLRREDLIGRSPDECMAPAVALPILDNYRRCLEQQATVKFASTRVLPVGKRDVEGSVSPVKNPATGRIVRLVGSARDVTERNRMEAAMRHGQKMEAIGRLAAGVAHDFNNILQAVIGGLDLLMEEAAPGTPAREFAGVALSSAMRGTHLTHHLLSYARKQVLWPQPIDLAAFLPEIEALLARTLGPHIAIALRVAHAPDALADPGELQTALLNLAINAAHAMPTGGTLQIGAREERDGPRSWVRLEVTDTGAGMDAATLAEATEPFFTTKGPNGTGLGLSMVQGFAEQSGGTLDIASTPGKGTTVALRLPAANAAHTAMSVAGGQGRIAGCILLVDDSTDVLVTVGAFLVRSGFTVVRADSGERALAALTQGRRFDALVSDYAMPGLNGVDLIARARLRQPGLPAIVITGYGAVVEAAASMDGVTILHKPFPRQTLVEAVHAALGRGTGAPGAVAVDRTEGPTARD